MKKMILALACSLGVSFTASAKLVEMTDSEMANSTTSAIFPTFDAKQTAIVLSLIANNKMPAEVLTKKINATLGPLNLEKVTLAQIDYLIRHANGVEFTDAVLKNNLQMVSQMMINQRLYNQQMLADAQRRAIIQTFFAAIVSTNFQGQPTLGNLVIALNTLNPQALLQQYPNIISPIYSLGNPNSPSINIIRNQ